jgi:DNA-directed RNA polymerase specialized sigma subunit
MVESIARSFNTSDTSSGILDIMDLIQYGSMGLIAAVEKLDIKVSMEKENPERSIKSFLAKRIKGAIRSVVWITTEVQ